VKFFGWVVPSWAGAHDAVKDACSLIHLASSWLLAAAIAAHVAATIYHQWLLRDGLFWRMWPSGGRARKRRAEARDMH
jgi:cytochrome b561